MINAKMVFETRSGSSNLPVKRIAAKTERFLSHWKGLNE